MASSFAFFALKKENLMLLYSPTAKRLYQLLGLIKEIYRKVARQDAKHAKRNYDKRPLKN